MSTKYKGEVVMSNNIKESVIKNFLSSLLSVENKISLNDFIDRIPQAFNLSDYDEENSSTRHADKRYSIKNNSTCNSVNRYYLLYT